MYEPLFDATVVEKIKKEGGLIDYCSL